MVSIKDLYNNGLMLESDLIIKPSDLLDNYISYYSFSLVKVSKIKTQLTIIPDASGCIVFTFNDTKMDSKVWGPTSCVTMVNKTEEKQAMMFKIEFIQGGLRYFTAEYQSDLRDKIVELEMVNTALNNKVCHLYEKSKSIAWFIEALEVYLIQLVHSKRKISAFDYSIQMVKKQNGQLSVKNLSKAVNYSERQLNRIYNEHLGMNIKMYTQLTRINKVIMQMKTQKINATALANEYYYYDQAHFTKAFKNICGVTPKVFLANMSDFYNEELKF